MQIDLTELEIGHITDALENTYYSFKETLEAGPGEMQAEHIEVHLQDAYDQAQAEQQLKALLIRFYGYAGRPSTFHTE